MSKREPPYHPPRWLDKLLERCCAPHLLEEVLGDLHERYYLRAQRVGEAKARKQYWRDVLAYMRPSIFKRPSMQYSKPIPMDMLKNYFTIAFRNLAKRKTFSVINIVGLALGISCSIFILLWIRDELSYDGFHKNGNLLYRVMENQYYTEGEIQTTPSTPGPLAEALKNEIPEITYATKMSWEVEELLSVGDKSQKEKGRYASADLFKMFSFPLVYGDPEKVLADPSSIVISEKLAENYFGHDNPIGKMIRVNNAEDYQVTGVFRNIPDHASLRFDYALPIAQFEKRNDWLSSWENNGVRTYLMIRPDASSATLNHKIKNFIRQKLPGATVDLFLQRYDNMYLYADFRNGKLQGGRIAYIHSFSVVAIIVLLIACINFMNLTTARSMVRAREIGIRKVNGATRQHLFSQFMAESVFFSWLAMILSIVMVTFFLPEFNLLTGKKIIFPLKDLSFLAELMGITFITGMIAGSYPAVLLSSFNVVKILKGSLRFGKGPVSLRKSLVVFQFFLTITLIFSTIVILHQINYIKTKNLGFDRDHLIYIPVEGELSSHMETFRQESLTMPGISSVTYSTTSPLETGNSTIAVNWPGKKPDDQILFTHMAVGYDFMKTMNIRLKEGRDFSPDYVTDSAAFIINEETASMMGLEEPLGVEITFWNRPGKIIGVTRDFHLNSLHTKIEPLILRLHTGGANFMIARLEAGKTEAAIGHLEKIFHRLNPAYPFEYHFVDDTFREQYAGENMVGKLADYFSVIAMVVSCLGLLGLILFSAEQKTKEIGIRKVLGATVHHIVMLLSGEFVWLVMMAFVLSVPVALYFMNRWLDNFAYHIKIDGWMFLLSGMIVLVIAMITVGFQSIKAALANPVDSLRNE